MTPDGDDDDDDDDDGEIVELPSTDVLDLHIFRPREVKDLVSTYLALAHERGLAEVRIIHGKGQGTLQRIVHAVCARHPRVLAFRLAGGDRGGWGATVVTLQP
jgi:dsDNA-specific endonuclease/ATPase MutS2